MENIAGIRYGHLVALKRDGTGPSGETMWLYKCDCGKVTRKNKGTVKSGQTKSCGCMKLKLMSEKATKHGLSKNFLYRLLYGIKTRCTNQNAPQYKNYGGRGIGYDQRWNDFSVYLKEISTLGPRPIGHSIDRIDVNGGYFLNNLRWASAKTQIRNRRNNRVITIGGKTQCLSAWIEESPLSPNTIKRRISAGWPYVEALTTPVITECFAQPA